jgi:hypothetical protein
MGFAPLTNPGVVVVVTLNGTRGEGGMGAYVAGPTFKVVASEALRVVDVPKDLPEATPEATLVAQSGREDMDDLAIADLGDGRPNILEENDEDVPVPPGTFGPPPAPVAAAPAPKGPKVPNFRGMTMRDVLAEAAAKGLTILPDGSGVARVQSPPPGSCSRGNASAAR